MTPTPAAKKDEDSGKRKRHRKEVDDGNQLSGDESKTNKKQNTSKTPVRSSSRPLATTNARATLTDVTNPTIDPNTLGRVDGSTETLVTTQTDSNEIIPTIRAVEEQPSGSSRKKKPVKEDPIVVVVSTPAEENSKGGEITKPNKRCLLWLNILLVLLLAVVTGLWVFERLNSELIAGELRLELQNCQALHSQQRKQDEYYLQELETQTRMWKRNAQSIKVELETLREQCQGT